MVPVPVAQLQCITLVWGALRNWAHAPVQETLSKVIKKHIHISLEIGKNWQLPSWQEFISNVARCEQLSCAQVAKNIFSLPTVVFREKVYSLQAFSGSNLLFLWGYILQLHSLSEASTAIHLRWMLQYEADQNQGTGAMIKVSSSSINKMSIY